MSNGRITRWTQGSFQVWDKPAWWDAAVEAIWADGDDEAAPIETFDAGMNSISVHDTPIGIGRVVEFESPSSSMLIWVSSEADLLDLLTSRGPAWLKLGNGEPSAHILRRISHTLIGFARHGAGEHIREDGMLNDIDERRRMERIDRRRTEKGGA